MITKHLNQRELLIALKADGVFDERPDIAHRTLASGTPYISKDVRYVLAGSEASHAIKSRAAQAAPVASGQPAVSDEEADRRLAAIEARRKVAPAPAPAPVPPVVKTRAVETPPAPAGVSDGGADLASIAMRGLDDTDGDSIAYLFRDPGIRAVERSAPTADTSAGAELVEFCMRGVNDVRLDNVTDLPVRAQASADIAAEALRGLGSTDYDGPPEAA
ncbi:MAG: hypothetical protein WDO69_24375 [Pseudomonadota bacterium]